MNCGYKKEERRSILEVEGTLRRTVTCNKLGIFGVSVPSGDIGFNQSVTVPPFLIGLGSVEPTLLLFYQHLIITLL